MNMTHYMELLATNQPWNLIIFMAIPVVLAETVAITELYILYTRKLHGWVRNLNRVAGIVVGLYFIGIIAYLLLKSGVGSLKHQMDSEEYGGAPFLGAKQPVIKAHGSSKAKGIKNAIRQAKICVENDLCGTMQSALDELNKE